MSTTVRIGQIPYLNCEPFFHGLVLEDAALYPMPPSYMGPLAQAGELDAAPFSLAQSFYLRGAYESLGDMGISVKGPVRSILFYSRFPIDQLSGGVVGATHESATAVHLMRVILEQRYGVREVEHSNLDVPNPDAFLLIGDAALATHDQVEGFPFRYDLAEEWLEWKGLPFVFAVWMARRTLEADVKDKLAEGLKRNMTDNMTHSLPAIARKREAMGLTEDEVIDYLQAFRYNLSQEDFQAIEEFEGAWRSLSLAKEATI